MLTTKQRILLKTAGTVALASGSAAPAFAADELDESSTLLSTTAVSPATLMPRAVTSFGAAPLGGYVYLLGGYFGTPHDYHREGQSDRFMRLNPTDGTWEELKTPGRMQSVALVAYEDALYRIGGMVALNQPGEDQSLTSIADFARYEPLINEWTKLPDLPEPRSSHMAAVIGDHVYVAGGWRIHPDDGGSDWHASLLRFDLSRPDGDWETIEQPFERRAVGVAAVDGRLAVIGGISSDRDMSRELDVFDPATGKWTSGPEFPGQAFGLAAVGIDGAVYASAGDGEIFSWSHGDDDWRQVTSWMFPRFFHQLVPSGAGELLAIGGVARGGRIRHVERLTLDGEIPDVRVSRFELPAPGAADGGHALVLKDNLLHVLGRTGARDAYRLDLAGLSWAKMSAPPVEELASAAGTKDNAKTVMAIGRHKPEGGVSTRLAAFEYDFKYDTWDKAGFALPDEGQAELVTVADGDDLFGFGAKSHEGAEILVRRSGAETFSATGSHMPRERTGFAVAARGDSAVLVGGGDAAGSSAPVCDVFHYEDGTWTELPASPTVRWSPQVAVLGGCIYVAGGRTAPTGGELVRSVEVLDCSTGEWSVVEARLPIEGDNLAMTVFGDRLVVYSARATEPVADLLIVDPGRQVVTERDVAGHFRR